MRSYPRPDYYSADMKRPGALLPLRAGYRAWGDGAKTDSWGVVPGGIRGSDEHTLTLTPYEHMQHWNCLVARKGLGLLVDLGHAFSYCRPEGGAVYEPYIIVRASRGHRD